MKLNVTVDVPLTLDQLAEYELRATMAERERCAKLAEVELSAEQVAALTTGFGAILPGDKIYQTAQATIAAAIRNSQ